MADELAVATDQAMEDSSVGEDQPSSFYDHDFGDGNVQSFATKEDLGKYLSESSLRQSDYTKKTQSLAEERRRFEREQADKQRQYEQEYETFKELKAKYDRYDEAFKKRPQLLQQIDRMVSQPSGPDEIYQRSTSYADEQVKALSERIEAMEAERERQNLERQRDEAYASLAEKYGESFDRERVNAMLNTLEEGNITPLLDLAARASLYNPEGAEAEVLQKLERKQGAKIPSGGGKPPPPKKGSSNLQESYEDALRDLGVEGV